MGYTDSNTRMGVVISEHGTLDDEDTRTTQVISERSIGFGTVEFHDNRSHTTQVSTSEKNDGSLDVYIGNKYGTAGTLLNSEDEYAFDGADFMQWDEYGNVLGFDDEQDTEFSESYGNIFAGKQSLYEII